MAENRVLVLMATYNGAQYLDAQLESLYAQTGVAVSVLVRDDGSSDRTQEILETWHEHKGLTWYTGEHLNVKYGFYDLMQRAAEMDYTYYAFCDQDDVWDSDKLAIAVGRLEEALGAAREGNAVERYEKDAALQMELPKSDRPAIYYSGQRLVDEELNLLDVHNLSADRTLQARFLLNDAAGCTEVFNQALLTKIVQYRPDYMLMHDTWLVKVCIALGGAVVVDTDAHMSYRQHTGNSVGLRHDLRSNLRRAWSYIIDQPVYPQMDEINKGYRDEITPEYREIVDRVLRYRYSITNKRWLLDRSRFDYADRRIQMVYTIKVLFNVL